MSARAALAVVLAVALAPAAARAQADRSRAEAHPSWGVRLGAATAVAGAASDTRTGIGGGAYLLYDIPGLLADLSVDVFGGPGALVDGGIGAYYPFVEGETSPYLGGGLKLGWSKFGGDGAFGLVPFAAAGLLVGRSWSPHVRLEVAWFYAVATERRDESSPGKHATGPIATIGIGF